MVATVFLLRLHLSFLKSFCFPTLHIVTFINTADILTVGQAEKAQQLFLVMFFCLQQKKKKKRQWEL